MNPDNKKADMAGRVGLTATTVPAGWWNGSAKLTVALSLRPVVNDECPYVDELPSKLFSVLKPGEISLQVKAIELGGGVECPTPELASDVTDSGNAVLLKSWSDRIDRHMAQEIDGLWKHVMPENEGDSFEALYQGMSTYYETIKNETAENNTNPEKSIGDLSGQIAVACQIERALVERMAIQNNSNWKERVSRAAVRAADRFLAKNQQALSKVLEKRPTPDQDRQNKEKGDKQLTSMTISIRREKAAAAITQDVQKKISEASQALGKALCGTEDVVRCREILRDGPADKNYVANMMQTSFESILTQLFYLNQVNILGSAMGAEEAKVVEKAAQTRSDSVEESDMSKLDQAADENARLYMSRMKELETNSEFGRLFGLIHDFKLTQQALDTIKSIPAINDPLCKPSHYMMIRIVATGDAAIRLLPEECSSWTFAKLADEGEGRAASFTPVSRQEVITVLGAKGNCDARDCEVLPELDGVQLLSAHYDGQHPAYELSSINPRDAMQDLDTRLSGIISHVAEVRTEMSIPDGTLLKDAVVADTAKVFAEQRPPSEPWPLAALKSRSLRLYHTHQHSRTDCELGRTQVLSGKRCEEMALDSEDLSIGNLYDAAVRCFNQTGDIQWHALCAANVHYSDARSNGIRRLDDVIDGFFEKGERQRYQRAGWALSQQVKRTHRQHGEEVAEGTLDYEDDTVVVADELVFEYGGEQQGTDNFVGERGSNNEPYAEPVQRSGLLDINRSHRSIAELEIDQKPIELLDGLGYYLGKRSVNVGGGSTPDNATRQILSGVHCAPVPRLTGHSEKPGHRLLRTEKIVKPLVLLNGTYPSNSQGRYTRTYLPNTTREVVLRSRLSKNGTYQLADKNEHNQEKLIVVPGNVDLELAYRNGVMNKVGDILAADGSRPRDGLPAIRMDGQGGGWATLDDTYQPKSNDDLKAVLTGRTINGTRVDTDPAPSNGIFLAGGIQKQRKQPYYPDPLHSDTAFRLRTPGSRDDWIGLPWVVRQSTKNYPDIIPISLTILRSESLSVKANEENRIKAAGVSCIDMQLGLPPGLNAELVIWPVPDLARFSISTEVVTLQAMVAMSAKEGLNCIDDLPGEASGKDEIVRCLLEAGLMEPNPAGKTCGIACSPSPSISQLKEVGKMLHQKLLQHPLDVVSGHTILTLIHAVDKPRMVPVPAFFSDFGIPATRKGTVGVSDSANPNIFARRSDPEKNEERPMTDAFALLPTPAPIDDGFIDEGELGLGLKGRGTDVDLAGFLEIDPLTTGSVEIDVISANPLQSKIDDEARSRGKMNVVTSVYPTDKKDGKLLTAEEIYGLVVNRDETITPIERKVRLARIENIPAFAQSLRERDLQATPWKPAKAYLSLYPLFTLATNSQGDDADETRATKDGITINVDPVLNFNQSRNLELRCRSIGRFMAKMTTRATKSVASIIPDIANEWNNETPITQLPLPSSRRPDPPMQAVKPEIVACPDIVEKVDGSDGYVKLTNRPVIRLSFKRPFFSSGVQERLGIVLSPRPSSFANDGKYDREYDGLTSKLDRFRLDNRFPDPKHLPAALVDQLTQFADKGTRPPLEPHPQELEKGLYGLYPVPLPLLQDGLFDELGRWIGPNSQGVEYVANAQLPVYADSHDPSKRGTRPEIFFPVDLLTYEPRFDVAKEYWYCNVALNPRYTLDPHLQLGVVRYQPLAPRDLRVSTIGLPMRCKVLPKRETTIKCARKGDNLLIDVVTIGRAAESETDGKDLGPKSLFTARVTGIERHGAKIVHRHVDIEKVMVPEFDIENSRAARFMIPANSVWLNSLVVAVEEVEERYAGTQSIEPVLPNTEQDRQKGGPVYRTSADITEFAKKAV